MSDRKPKPKQGTDLRKTLERIADGCTDVDEAAAARYAAADSLDHTDVAALARSSSPTKRKAARLRAAAMLAGLDRQRSRPTRPQGSQHDVGRAVDLPRRDDGA